MKSKLLPLLIVVAIACLLFVPVVSAAEAPDLPPDNLITNPWFRDASNTTGSHDGWTVGEEWGLSQKNHNPTPDGVQGTSVRLGIPKATFGVDSYIYTVVEANPDNLILRFQTWAVSRNLYKARVIVYGSESLDGPWEALWQPWYEEHSSISWIQTPLVETTLAKGFPYYKVEYMCNYGQGTAGCKFTGVYFTASSVSNPEAVAVEDLPPVTAQGGGRGSAETGSDQPATEPMNVNFEGVAATAVAHDQITLSWPEQEDAELNIEIERSPDGRRAWEPVSTVAAATMTYTDAQLTPETTYYYRLIVRVTGQGRVLSEIVSATTAVMEEPTATPEPVAVVPTETPESPAPEPVPATAVPPTVTPVPAAPAPETTAASPPWLGTVLGFVAGMLVAVGGTRVWSRRRPSSS